VALLSKGAPLWIPLGKAKEIDRLVRRYSTLVRGLPEEEKLSENLQELYEALWAPIGQALSREGVVFNELLHVNEAAAWHGDRSDGSAPRSVCT
jgi:hypothetical protein